MADEAALLRKKVSIHKGCSATHQNFVSFSLAGRLLVVWGGEESGIHSTSACSPGMRKSRGHA